MNFPKTLKASWEWCCTVMVWLWILPGVVEIGLWFIFVCLLLVGPLRESLSNRHSLFCLLVLGSCSFAFFITAMRERLHPVLGRLAASVGIVMGVGSVWPTIEAMIVPCGLAPPGSWTETLYHHLQGFMFLVAFLTLSVMAVHRGMKQRHRDVAGLIKILATGSKNARRRAIQTLDEIARLDRAAAHADGAAWARRFWQWFFRCDTASPMADAVPALQGALRDGDLFLRIQAAKALRTMGVSLP